MTSKQFNTEEGQKLYQLENEYRRMREKNGYTRSLAVMGDRIEKLKLKIEKLYPESAETKEFLPSDLPKKKYGKFGIFQKHSNGDEELYMSSDVDGKKLMTIESAEKMKKYLEKGLPEKNNVNLFIKPIDESAETKEFLPSDLSKTGEPIYIKMPPLPDLPEKNVVLKYDQNNFIFNVFEGNKKIGAVNEKQVLQNLNNGEYIIIDKFAKGGSIKKIKIGDEGMWHGGEARVKGRDDIGNVEIIRIDENGKEEGDIIKVSEESFAEAFANFNVHEPESSIPKSGGGWTVDEDGNHVPEIERIVCDLSEVEKYPFLVKELLALKPKKIKKELHGGCYTNYLIATQTYSCEYSLFFLDLSQLVEGLETQYHVNILKKTYYNLNSEKESVAEATSLVENKIKELQEKSFAHGGVAENEKANEVIARFKDGIKSKADMQLFFSKLHIDLDLIFHPDDNFESYVSIDSNKKTFSKSQAAGLDKILDDCFAYCDKHNLDIYEIALDQAKKDGVLPVGIGEEEEAYADGGLPGLALQRDKLNEYRTLRNKGEDEEKIAVIIKHDFRNHRINAVTLWTVLSGNDDVVSGAGASKIYSDLGFKPFEGYPLTTKDGQTVFEKGGELTEKKKKEIDKKMIEFLYNDEKFIAAQASRSELIKRKNKIIEQKEELFKKGEHKGIHDKLVAIDDEVDAIETEYLRVSNEIVALLEAERNKLKKEAGVGEDNIIGQTRSGKPIYDNADSDHHKDFTWEDYDDALDAGDKKMDEAMKEKDNDKITFYFKLKNKFAKGRMNFARADIDEEYGTDKDDQFAKGGSAGRPRLVPKGAKLIYHHAAKGVDELKENKDGVWFTTNPFFGGQIMDGRPGIGSKTFEYILYPDKYRWAPEKEFWRAGQTPEERAAKLKEWKYDGVKFSDDGDTRYLIFDLSILEKKSEYIVDKDFQKIEQKSFEKGGSADDKILPAEYYKTFHLKGNGRRVYTIFQSHRNDQLKYAARQLFSGMTYDEHKELADKYHSLAKEETEKYDAAVNDAFKKKFGKEPDKFGLIDYKVSGIYNDEIFEDDKDRIRAILKKFSEYLDAFYLHNAMLKKADKLEGKFEKLARGGKAKKSGTIETDTSLLPWMIAEIVAEDKITEHLKLPFNEEREKRSKELQKFLVERADVLYKNNEHFKRSLNAAGNKGRDNLYMWFGHWSDAYIKTPKYFDREKEFGKKESADKKTPKFNTGDRVKSKHHGSGTIVKFIEDSRGTIGNQYVFNPDKNKGNMLNIDEKDLSGDKKIKKISAKERRAQLKENIKNLNE